MDRTLPLSSPHHSAVPATTAPRLARTLSGWPVKKLQGKELRNKLLEPKLAQSARTESRCQGPEVPRHSIGVTGEAPQGAPTPGARQTAVRWDPGAADLNPWHLPALCF